LLGEGSGDLTWELRGECCVEVDWVLLGDRPGFACNTECTVSFDSESCLVDRDLFESLLDCCFPAFSPGLLCMDSMERMTGWEGGNMPSDVVTGPSLIRTDLTGECLITGLSLLAGLSLGRVFVSVNIVWGVSLHALLGGGAISLRLPALLLRLPALLLLRLPPACLGCRPRLAGLAAGLVTGRPRMFLRLLSSPGGLSRLLCMGSHSSYLAFQPSQCIFTMSSSTFTTRAQYHRPSVSSASSHEPTSRSSGKLEGYEEGSSYDNESTPGAGGPD